MRTLLVLCVCAVALTTAQPAFAQGRFHGENARGQVVELLSDKTGRIVRATVEWTLRCGPIREPLEVTSTMRPEAATAGRSEFAAVADEDEVGAPPDEGSLRIETAITGLRRVVRGRPGAESWTGTFEGTVEVRGDGPENRLIKRCEIRPTRWRAWREGLGTGTWRHTSDPGDYVGGGLPRVFDRGNSEMSAWGDPNRIHVTLTAGEAHWSAHFAVPEGAALERGARYAVAEESGGIPPDMAVAGEQRSCGGAIGEFTVRSARYRRGRLRAVAIDFAQSCNGTAFLRGTIEWRASR